MRGLWCMLCAIVLTNLAALAATDPSQTIRLKEYLGQTWADELISYPVDAALRTQKTLRVVDEAGQEQPYQLHDGRIYLLVTLPADGEKVFTVSAGTGAAAPAKPAKAAVAGEVLTLDSGAMAVRMPAGERVFPQSVDAKNVPGPIQGVRGLQGGWVGKSWLDAPLKVTGHATKILANGPLFADAQVDYAFEGGKHYRFTARVIAGQPTAIIDEWMDLNPGGKYTLLHYPNAADASTWEWWSLSDSDHLGVKQAAYPRANLVLSFKEGLQPNQARWVGGRVSHPKYGVDAAGKPLMDVEAGEAFVPITYAEDERVNRIAGWWLNSFSNYSYSYTMLNDTNPQLPAVSISTGRASRNVNPNLNPTPEPWIKMITGFNDLAVWTKPQTKDLQVIGAICLGSREWLLTAEPQAALPPKGGQEWPIAYKAVIKYSRFPLEKIKDWSFDWPEPKNAWPRLFCKAGDFDGMKARVAAAPPSQHQHYNMPAIYKPGTTPEQMARQAHDVLKGCTVLALTGRGHGSNNWFHASLHMFSTMPIWEAALATPGIDPKLRAKIKAYGAFVAQRAWDEDYWPGKETNNGWGSVNMGTLAGTARVLTASAMAGMPGNEARLRRCRGYLDGNLQPLVAPDGAAVSCPHYIGASMDPILYMALALKYGGGYDAFKEDARLARFGQFMIDILTPPDPRSPKKGPYTGLPFGSKLDPATENRRNIWPLGHTSRTEPTAILDMLALGYSGLNDKLAGALYAASVEMGQASGGFIPAAMLSNTTVTPAMPELRTRWYPHYGAILRDNQPRESWFAIRYSKFAFDHFQSDMGAFTFFAKGVPMLMDFGSMYSPENGQGVYHNRVVWNVREGALQPCPGYGKAGCFYQGYAYFEHKHEPWTDQVEANAPGQGIIDHFGDIRSFATLPTADYLLGQTDVKALLTEPYFPETPEALKADPNQKRTITETAPFSWQRRVLMPKLPTGHTYLLVRDDFTAPCPAPMVNFWIAASTLDLRGNQAHATGQFGVDLEAYVAQPAQPKLSQWQWEHKNWGGEKQVCLRVSQPEGKPFLTLLYPREADAPMPVFTTIAGGNGVKTVAPGETHYSFLATTPVDFTDGALRFRASAGYLLVTQDGTAVIALSTPGLGAAAGMTLETTQPASLQVAGKRLVLHTSGEAQTVKITGKLPVRITATLDGAQKLRATPKAGVLTLNMPAGVHEVVIE